MTCCCRIAQSCLQTLYTLTTQSNIIPKYIIIIYIFLLHKTEKKGRIFLFKTIFIRKRINFASHPFLVPFYCIFSQSPLQPGPIKVFYSNFLPFLQDINTIVRCPQLGAVEDNITESDTVQTSRLQQQIYQQTGPPRCRQCLLFFMA